MTTVSSTRRTRLGLLLACIVALALILALSLAGRHERGLACAPLANAATSEAPRAPVQLEAVGGESAAPPATTGGTAVLRPAPPQTPAAVTAAGNVFDARTREAVPWIDVELAVGDVHWIGRTDAAGNFACTTAFESGDMKVRVTDGGAHVGSVTVPWPQPFLRLPVPIGPTVFVSSIGDREPKAREPFVARLVQTGREVGSAGEIEVVDEQLSMAVGPDLAWSEVPVRLESGQLFARWPKVEREESPDYRAQVVFQSSDRLERGVVGITRTIGQQAAGHVRTERFVSVTGSLRDTRSSPVQNGRVLIRPSNVGQEFLRRSRVDCVELESSSSTFQTALAAKGSYVVVSWADGYEPRNSRLRRASGRNESASFEREQLYPLVERAFASPTRVLEPGFDPANTAQFVRARVIGAEGFGRAEVVAWPGGAARSEIEMPRTRYDVELVGIDRAPITAGCTWSQVLPGPLLPPLESGAHPLLAHRIEWIDPTVAGTRADFLLTAGPAGCIVTTHAFDGTSRWSLIARSSARFTVWRAGFEPEDVGPDQFGTEEGERVARVRLQPGWGVTLSFRIVDAAPEDSASALERQAEPRGALPLAELLALPALAGVQVSSASGELGTSDGDGFVLVKSRSWPPHLSLVAPGWRLCDLQRMDGPGARWIAFMERDE